MLLKLAIILASLLVGFSSGAAEPTPVERKQLLDAARPQIAALANQPVRIKVDRINVDSRWAVLVGSVVAVPDKRMDWSLSSCHPDLDKMLWVVLHKSGNVWRVKHIDICASEPPYWYLEQYGGLVWPCGVYAGLKDAGDEQWLEQRCQLERAGRKR